jgi:transcriptional regulator with XRE-family HTH domain
LKKNNKVEFIFANMLQLNNNIKLIRELSGLKQKDFARLIKTNLSNLKTYENSSVRPKANVLAAICDYAGITQDDLENKALTHKEINIPDSEVEKVETRQEGNFLLGSVTLQDHISVWKQWKDDLEQKYQDAKADKERLTDLIEKNLSAILLSLSENRDHLKVLQDQMYIATTQLEDQRAAREKETRQAVQARVPFVKKRKGDGAAQRDSGNKDKNR